MIVSKSWPWLEQYSKQEPKDSNRKIPMSPQLRERINILIDKAEKYRKMQAERMNDPKVREMLGFK